MNNTIFKTSILRFVILLQIFTVPCFVVAQQAQPWQAKWIQIGFAEDQATRPTNYFEKQVNLKKKVRQAKLIITAHGLYEAAINGRRVGDTYLTPGWTDYQKRLQYQTYDVTALIRQGKNHLSVAVGDGWYRGIVAFHSMQNLYGTKLALLAQLEVTYNDGQKEIIGSDTSWKCGTGPIRSSSINNGETVDHNQPLHCDQPVQLTGDNYDNLVPETGVPVTKHETFKPIESIITPSGEKVLDFGQNLTGWVTVRLKGHKGDTIHIQHGEILDRASNFYNANLRSAKAMATYVLSGDEEEFFEPHFTFFGFRYIKVTGLQGNLKPDDFTAVALYADMKPTGSFECSNPLLNQLQHNIVWSQKGNFLSVPTDCPQRDERVGWVGDAQVFCRTASFNFNVDGFLSNWLRDMTIDQHPDGAVAFVTPDILGGEYSTSAGWSDAATIIPWTLYEVYGDKATLERQYPTMKAWVDYMQHTSINYLWNTSKTNFGDWLSYRSPNDDGTDAITDKQEIAQCFYGYSTQLLINAAKALGKDRDAQYYSDQLVRIKAAYHKEYVTPNGRLMSNTQTAYALALQFDMLPENERPVAAKYLADNIKAYKNHLTTGFLGTPYLCHVLSRFGYTDVAYKLLLQDTYPSWLYPVKMGATTIWERWDGIKPDGSFQTTVMNSFNHYAYGAIGDWMYRVMAGIDNDAGVPGYKKIIIKPHPGGNLTWCKASYETPQGKISVSWKIKEGKFKMDVTIPPNSTATIAVPDITGSHYTEHNVQAGEYHFES